MTTPANKTMLNYFTKLPLKSIVVEETNPRKLAPAFNKQHVEDFQNNRLEQFDAVLYKSNQEPSLSEIKSDDGDQNFTGSGTISNPGVDQAPEQNYIESLKSGRYKPFRVKHKLRGCLRSKLLQYSEDVRPPYFGTWQKKSTRVTGRRPFSKDESIFDYEVDSEAEWDIGGPGESLKGDDSEDEEEQDDYEIDMKTFVPHGYVSDDEIEEHSDQEDNGSSSANQSIEEEIICDLGDDSNASVMIIGEKRIKLTTMPSKQNSNNNGNGNKKIVPTKLNSPQHQSTAMLAMKQPKVDIKPIVLGIYYENQPTSISESKIHFLRAYQGSLCT